MSGTENTGIDSMSAFRSTARDTVNPGMHSASSIGSTDRNDASKSSGSPDRISKSRNSGIPGGMIAVKQT